MKPNANVLVTLKPSFFNTKVNSTSGLVTKQYGLDESLNLNSSSSFRYDPFDTGLKSTQQFNIDWSDFSQHIFYGSAQVKTNEAFKTIINKFPFDGTQKDFESFEDSLTGYQKYIFDNFPYNFGYFFSEGDGYITVKDASGTNELDISTLKTGISQLNPTSSTNFAIENWLWFPSQSNDNSIIVQKQSGSHGISEWISSSNAPTVLCGFTINSGAFSISVSSSIDKGVWNHVCCNWDRSDGINQLNLFIGGNLIASSSRIKLSDLNINNADLTIFSGSSFRVNNSTFLPTAVVSGAIDELRIWHKNLSVSDIVSKNKRNIFQTPEMKLYFKFNEPEGTTKNIILDHSSNNLFGLFTTRSFNTGSIGSTPLVYEQSVYNPILFSNIDSVRSLRENLLETATSFDQENPSLITNLIPPHYFQEGKVEDGLSTEVGDIEQTITGSLPKTVELGSTQTLNSLLYSTADFFDEIQIFIKEFGNLIHVDYDETNVISDYFLNFLAKRYGIELPDLFSNANLTQFVYGDNIDDVNSSTSNNSLQKIQNQIWKRILINAKDILNSKGTRYSIDVFLRSIGIEPYSFFKIKEYGGPLEKTLIGVRETRQEIFNFLSFTTSSSLTSSFLTLTRVEPGYPVRTSNPSDNLLTSGSWTIENLFILNPEQTTTQSLARLSLKTISGNQESAVGNLYTIGTNKICFDYQPNSSFLAVNSLSLSLTGSFNLYDKTPWHITVGKQRADSIEMNSSPSSSIFIKIGKQNQGEIVEFYSTSSFFDDNGADATKNLTTNFPTSIFVPSGAILSHGSCSFLGSLASETNQMNYFDGKVSQTRFWTKALTDNETFEHIRNIKSIGVENPLVNNQFETKQSGSYEKIRLIQDYEQIISSSSFIFSDLSQNNISLYGDNFDSSDLVEKRSIKYSIPGTSFTEAITDNKVRVRSLIDPKDYDLYAVAAPKHVLEIEEQPTDNTKVSIDFGITEMLNADIVNLFGDYSLLENILGDPANLFSIDYPELESLRRLYFNRLTTNINIKSFFEFYKWFNMTLSDFIRSLLSKNVKFKGINFVIQPHLLESSKVQYKFYNQYLNRTGGNSSVFAPNIFQTIQGVVRTY